MLLCFSSCLARLHTVHFLFVILASPSFPYCLCFILHTYRRYGPFTIHKCSISLNICLNVFDECLQCHRHFEFVSTLFLSIVLFSCLIFCLRTVSVLVRIAKFRQFILCLYIHMLFPRKKSFVALLFGAHYQ